MYFKDSLDSLLSCCFLSWDNALYEFTVIFFDSTILLMLQTVLSSFGLVGANQIEYN